MACLEKRDRGIVIDLLRMHRPHHGNLVGDRSDVRNDLAEFLPGGRVLDERELGRGDGEAGLRGGHARESLAAADRIGQLRSLAFEQVRLGIEQVHLRRAARLEQVNHALRAGREMR